MNSDFKCAILLFYEIFIIRTYTLFVSIKLNTQFEEIYKPMSNDKFC